MIDKIIGQSFFERERRKSFAWEIKQLKTEIQDSLQNISAVEFGGNNTFFWHLEYLIGKKRLEEYMSHIYIPTYGGAGQRGYPTALDQEDWEDYTEQQFWTRMYPERSRRMQSFIEEQCSRMDYSGSMIYDEVPDQVSLNQFFQRIYELWCQEHPEDCTEDVDLRELVETKTGHMQSILKETPTWKDVLRIFFYQELQNLRRRRKNNQKKYWF